MFPSSFHNLEGIQSAFGQFQHRELRARYGKAYSANQPRSQALSPLSPLYEEKEAMRYGRQRRESLGSRYDENCVQRKINSLKEGTQTWLEECLSRNLFSLLLEPTLPRKIPIKSKNLGNR